MGYVKAAFALFGSKKWWEGFIPIYGFFCGPGYGIGGAGADDLISCASDAMKKRLHLRPSN